MKELSIKQYLAEETVKQRITDLLNDRANQFIITVGSITQQNPKLAECEPRSLVGACLTATAMDLPVNQNLGFVYIIPYTDRKSGVTEAQLQFGYRALIQLAMRSGQFQTISASPIYEGQLVGENPLTGYEFDFSGEKNDKIIGYAGYFKLLNGFEKILYMTVEELEKHGKKYSQTYKKGFGLWKDDFDGMATKTVLKLLLSKFAPLSVTMQKAVLSDQAIIRDIDEEPEYIDNKPPSLEEVQEFKEVERIEKWIEEAETVEKLQEVEKHLTTKELKEAYKNKLSEIKENEF
jgi:recombination protein RecT